MKRMSFLAMLAVALLAGSHTQAKAQCGNNGCGFGIGLGLSFSLSSNCNKNNCQPPPPPCQMPQPCPMYGCMPGMGMGGYGMGMGGYGMGMGGCGFPGYILSVQEVKPDGKGCDSKDKTSGK